MKKGNNNKQTHGDESVSLNKYISDTGFCSRREADEYIDQLRVTINGKDAFKGNRVSPGDVVEIDGEPIKKKAKTIYIALNKPAGVTSTTNLTDKTNIIDYLQFPQRIFPVGRLDKDSEGLIFLTNDGDIVNKILRAGNNHEKEYTVGVAEPITPDFIKQMSSGVKILNEWTRPCKVTQEGKSSFRITLTQGLNRQIRRMCEALGYKVTRLTRVRIMNVHLGKLPVGHWRHLTQEEINTIMKLVSESDKTEDASRVVVKRPKIPVKKEAPVKEEKVQGKKEAHKTGKNTSAKPTDGKRKDDRKNGKPAVPKSKNLSYKEFRERKR